MSETATSAAPATSTDPGTTPPPAAPTPAPATDPAAEQKLADAEKTAQQAQADRDDVLAALRRVLDPSGIAGEQDPATLAEQAATERDAALAEARTLRVELAAHRAAHGAGADPARLLDSRTVEKQLAELDPTDTQFTDKLTAVIAAAVDANPLLRAEGAPAGPLKGGADFTPTTGATTTSEQFARMSYGERVELHQSDPDLYRQLSAASE